MGGTVAASVGRLGPADCGRRRTPFGGSVRLVYSIDDSDSMNIYG